MHTTCLAGMDTLGAGDAPAIRRSYLAPHDSVTLPSLLVASIGGLVGYGLWRKKHPVLGFLGGVSAAVNGKRLIQDDDRPDVLRHLAMTGAAIGTSLAYRRHPAIGYAGGLLGSGLILTRLGGEPMWERR